MKTNENQRGPTPLFISSYNLDEGKETESALMDLDCKMEKGKRAEENGQQIHLVNKAGEKEGFCDLQRVIWSKLGKTTSCMYQLIARIGIMLFPNCVFHLPSSLANGRASSESKIFNIRHKTCNSRLGSRGV